MQQSNPRIFVGVGDTRLSLYGVGIEMLYIATIVDVRGSSSTSSLLFLNCQFSCEAAGEAAL